MTTDLKIVKSNAPTFLTKEDKICNIIKGIVSNYFEMPYDLYDSRSRKREIIQMKQIAVYFIRKFLPNTSLVYTGKIMKYDHASIIHCIKKVNDLMQTDLLYRKNVNDILQIVQEFYDDLTKDEKNYIININECVSLKINNSKTILLSGFDENEVNDLMQRIDLASDIVPVKHEKTGIFIIENQ